MAHLERAYRKCGVIGEQLYPMALRPRQCFTREVLRSSSPERVMIDLGCGRYPVWLRSLARAFAVCYGIDPELTGRAEGNLRLLQGSAYAIPLAAESVDIVTMRNVVEHLDRPGEVLRECARVLRPGGSVFILAPNKWFPPIALGRLFPHSIRRHINCLLNNRKLDDTFPAYYRANTEADLRRLSRAVGLVPAKMQYLSEHPAYFTFSTVFYRCWAAFERRCLRLESFAAFRHFVFCRLDLPR